MQPTSVMESGSTYAKGLFVSEAKVGKTVWLAAQALGVFPGQKFGGVVDDPSNLWIVGVDSGSVSGVGPFLKACGMKEADIKKIKFMNLQDVARRAAVHQHDWNFEFFNKLVECIKEIESKARGVTVVIPSSLTTIAQVIERSLAGPSSEDKKGSGMDQAKWSDLGRQINEIRNLYQQDKWHCFWEGHIYKPPNTGQNKQEEKKETLQVSGKSGYNFANNVEQIIRLRRLFGETFEKSRIDKVYMDTRPSLDFVSGGRCFTERLDAKEWDLTVALYKLGLKVGRWGAKKSSTKEE